MAEFIGNMFGLILTAIAETGITIVHIAENLFGVGGAIIAVILICRLAHKR